MERVINEMIDEGDVETRAFYTVQLTKQGRIKAKERKLDQKYSEEQYKNRD